MSATGTLKVIHPDGTTTLTWNGVVEDRERARARFNELTESGCYMAMVFETGSKARQVTTFEEIEQVEKERGFVEAKLQPAIVGG